MNKLLILSAVLTGALLGLILAAAIVQAYALNEDQLIVCVNGHVVNQSGLICHEYNMDDLDYYQVIGDKSLFDLNDSFNMEVLH